MRIKGPDARHRPVIWSGSQGAPVFSSVEPPRRAERPGVSPRPRRHVFVTHGGHMLFRARGSVCLWNSTRHWLRKAQPPRKQENACVPHATILSACNSQRRHALGALTECLASPHCWVLGPPTSTTGHHPITTSRQPCLNRLGCRTERPAVATGPSHLASGAGDEPARLLIGARRRKDSRKAISEKEEFAGLCASCARAVIATGWLRLRESLAIRQNAQVEASKSLH